MKLTLSNVLAVAGILLAIYSIIGRFVGGQTVFSYLIKPDGIKAASAMVAANTLLLLAILANLCKKQ